MNRGGNNTGGGPAGGSTFGGPFPPQTSPASYMTPYSGPAVTVGASPGYPPSASLPVSSADQFGTNNIGFGPHSGGNGGGSYYNQSSPNEDGGGPGGYYGPSSGSSPRDLSYYGYNNGFGGGGDSASGGNAFYHQPASAQQQDNNNKVSLSTGDATSTTQAAAASAEFQGDTIKNEPHEVQPTAAAGSTESTKDSETCSVTTVDHMDPSISDMNNSDNQKPRSQSSPTVEHQHSPRTLPGQLPRRSPASHESSEFEQQQQPPHSFDPSLMTSPHPDEYLRQMSAMGSQSEGMPPYGLQMQYGQQPQQQQMWDNYYNYPGQQQQQHGMHMQQPAMMDNNYGLQDNSWWSQQQQQHSMMSPVANVSPGGGGTRPPSDYANNFRAPGMATISGSWMVRGARPRNDRRGPGRPRIGPGAAGPAGAASAGGMNKAGSPGSGDSRGHLRPRLMSPPPGSYSPFASEMGSPSPAGASEANPGSPSPSGFDPHRLPTVPTDPVPGPSHVGGVVPSPPIPSTSGDSGVGVSGGGGKAGSSKAANANKKRYHCEICGKKFSTAWYVRVHRKSHSGERPYICHNCGKGFMLPNVLQVHLRKCEKNNPSAAAGAAGGSNNPGSSKANNRGSGSNGPSSSAVGGPSLDGSDHSQEVGMPQSSPAGLPQQGFLEGPGGFNNGGNGYNQRYEMGIPGGMPTPPFHHGGMSGGGPGDPAMFDHPFDPSQQQQQMYGGPGPAGGQYNVPTSNVPAHFLANDRPPDEGGGFIRGACDMCDVGAGKCPLHVQPQSSKIHVCTLCDKRFPLKAMFEAHLKTHRTMTTVGNHHPVSIQMQPHNGLSDYFTDLPPSPSFSPGIPTPQSSLDSLTCFASASSSTSSTVSSIRQMPGGVLKDPLSELTATVEAAVPSARHDSPPPSMGSSGGPSAPPIIT